MGLFTRRREEELSNQTTNAQPTVDSQSTRVESVTANREELNKLLSEFRSMQSDNYGQNAQPEQPATPPANQGGYSANYTNEGADQGYVPTSQEVASNEFANRVTSAESGVPHDTVEEGDKYSLSSEDTFQIEKYLLGDEDEEDVVVLPAEDALEDEDFRPEMQQEQPVYREEPVAEQPVYREEPVAEQPVYREEAEYSQPVNQYAQPVQQQAPVQEEVEEYQPEQPVYREEPVAEQPVYREEPEYREPASKYSEPVQEEAYAEDEEVEEEYMEDTSDTTITMVEEDEDIEEEVIDEEVEEYQPEQPVYREEPVAEQPVYREEPEYREPVSQYSEPVQEEVYAEDEDIEEVVEEENFEEEYIAPEEVVTEEDSYVEEEPEEVLSPESNGYAEEPTEAPLNIRDLSTPYNYEEEVRMAEAEEDEMYEEDNQEENFEDNTEDLSAVDELLNDDEDIDFSALENLKVEVEEQELSEPISPVEEPQSEPVEEVVAEEPAKEAVSASLPVEEPTPQPKAQAKEEDLDEKLNERFSAFEEKLLAKLMATIGTTRQAESQEQAKEDKKATLNLDLDADIDVLDTTSFKGEVVIFEPLEKVKKATWEDVVRRKGHYAYHVTAATNGGWWVKRARSANPFVYAEDKDEAMQIAIVYAKREKAELKLHNKKGVIEKSMSFGREKKIN